MLHFVQNEAFFLFFNYTGTSAPNAYTHLLFFDVILNLNIRRKNE